MGKRVENPAQAEDKMRRITFDPAEDGVSHINFFTRGKTKLGRMGSNLSDGPLNHPLYGHFRSPEGLWYYLKTGMKEDILRVVSGYEAKEMGKKLETVWNANFHREFKMGILARIMASEDLRNELKNSTLPLVHYYTFPDRKDRSKLVVIVPKGHEWQMDFWSSMRTRLQKGEPLEPVMDGLINFKPSEE